MPADSSQARQYGEALADADEKALIEQVLEPVAERHAAFFGAIATEDYMQDSGFSTGSTMRDPNDSGPLRIDTGDLARAVRGDLQARGDFVREVKIITNGIQWTQTLTIPYAAIHEYGGRIPATEKMEGFFWAKMYDAGPDTPEGERWKALALGAKANSHFTIQARPYAEPANEDALPETAAVAETLLTTFLTDLGAFE